MKVPLIIKKGEAVTVQRFSNKFVKGRHKTTSTEEFDAIASVQPITGAEVLQLSEGDRKRQHFWVFSEFQFLVNDFLVRNSLEYEIQSVQDWGSYRRARAVLKDV